MSADRSRSSAGPPGPRATRLAAGSQFAHRVQGPVIRGAFGLFLIASGLFFTIDRIVAR